METSRKGSVSATTGNNVLKTVILGDVGVGKTSLIHRLMYQRFSENQDSTIGCSFHRSYVDFGGEPYKVDIWDTAGQERFRSMMPLYYRNADIVYLCLDLGDDAVTFRDKFEYWKRQLDTHTPSYHQQKVIVVGTKADTVEDRLELIRLEYHSYFVDYPAVSYFFVSAKEDTGILRGTTTIADVFQQSYRLYFRDRDGDVMSASSATANASASSANASASSAKASASSANGSASSANASGSSAKASGSAPVELSSVSSSHCFPSRCLFQ